MINADKFIFHTDLVPLSVPVRVDLEVESPTSIGASNDTTYGRREYYYSPWKDIGFANGAPDVYYETPDGVVRRTWTEYQPNGPGTMPQIHMFIQQNNLNQLRAIMRVTNTASSTVSYPKTKIKAYVPVYLLAPPQ